MTSVSGDSGESVCVVLGLRKSEKRAWRKGVGGKGKVLRVAKRAVRGGSVEAGRGIAVVKGKVT